MAEISERARHDSMIREIGICRYFGRVNSGLIDPELGHQVINDFVRECEQPPRGIFNRIIFVLTS